MDISRDIYIFNDGFAGDGSLANVSYTQRATTGNTTISISSALKFNESIDEKAESFGLYTDSKVSYLLPNSGFYSGPISGALIGDEITELTYPNNIWWITSTTPGQWNGGWICACVKLNINSNLADTISHLRPNWYRDSYGTDSLNGYATVSGNIPARIQPIVGAKNEIGDKMVKFNHYNIYLTNNLPNIVRGDIISDASGNYYRIESWQHKTDIKALMVIYCVGNIEGGV